jgi:hypothetical protein
LVEAGEGNVAGARAAVPALDDNLVDGTPVDSDSDAWREECEARAVLRLPTLSARREYLDAVGKRRGVLARNGLENVIWRVWQAKNGS